MYAAISNHLSWLFRPARFLFGDSVTRQYRVKGWETLLFVEQPQEVEAVNAATGSVFLGGAGNEFLSALLGTQSVFLLDHQQHRLARRIMAPALTANAVQKHTSRIDRIVLEELSGVLQQQKFAAGPWSRRVAMRVVCEVALGVNDPIQIRRLLSRFEATTGYLANIVSYARRFWQPRGLFSIGTLTALLVRRIDNELYPIIETAKANPPEQPVAIIDLLVREQQKHGYDDAFIRDNLVAVLAAGYDTTGAALSWMLFWFGRDSKTQKQLAIASRDNDTSALQAFRDEVLRYCPPVEILPRRISPEHRQQAEQLVEGLDKLPHDNAEGPLVCPFVHRIHHNQQVWTDPDKFDLQRFNGKRRYGKNEFLPFGAGHRLCVGMNLGRLILDRALLEILAQDVPLHTGQKVFNPVRRNVSIWPGFNLQIKIGNI